MRQHINKLTYINSHNLKGKFEHFALIAFDPTWCAIQNSWATSIRGLQSLKGYNANNNRIIDRFDNLKPLKASINNFKPIQTRSQHYAAFRHIPMNVQTFAIVANHCN